MLENYITALYGMTRIQAAVQFIGCHRGKHVLLQMDGFCIYCGAHVTGNPLASPNNPPKVGKAELWRQLRGSRGRR